MTKEEIEKLNQFLDMSVEEFTSINEAVKKEGANKELSRRMIFFTSGFVFMFEALGHKQTVDNLEYPDKDIVMMRIADILKMCKEQREGT